jgi:hypothetical protein
MGAGSSQRHFRASPQSRAARVDAPACLTGHRTDAPTMDIDKMFKVTLRL